MFKKYYLFLFFIVISQFFFSCGPTCESGQVYLKDSNECVTDTCINFHCGTGASCVVTKGGPECQCPSAFQTIDENGDCKYDGLDDISCSGHGQVTISSGEPSCSCDAGYTQMSNGVLACVPGTFATYCNGGTCSNGKIIPYFENKPNGGVNFFIAGDGYTRADLGYNGKFAKDAKKFIGFLMKREPYKSFAKYINFYVVFAESRDNGIDLGNCSANRVNSALDTCIENPGNSTLVRISSTGRSNLDRYIRRSGKRAHLKIIVLNEDRYHAGTAYPSYNIGMFPRKAGSNSEIVTDITLYHEVGHAFGGLGDEYGAQGSSFSNPPALSGADRYPNLSLTSNTSRIKWSHLISHYSGLGAYEGGYYRDSSVWRPTNNSCVMRSLNATDLCPVCKEAIVKKFYTVLGLRYKLDDFLHAFPPNSRKAYNNEYELLTPQEKYDLQQLDLKFHNHQDVILMNEHEIIEH